MSHPSWVCGLKQGRRRVLEGNAKSHPSWVCGLKLLIEILILKIVEVTPFVGVWIETAMVIYH